MCLKWGQNFPTCWTVTQIQWDGACQEQCLAQSVSKVLALILFFSVWVPKPQICP